VCRIANRVRSENDRRLQELAETSSGRSETEPGLGGSLGSSEVTDDNNSSTSIAKARNGGQRRSNAPVVRDVGTVEGHIQAAAKKDLLAAKIAE
jgi:hypothetical protein